MSRERAGSLNKGVSTGCDKFSNLEGVLGPMRTLGLGLTRDIVNMTHSSLAADDSVRRTPVLRGSDKVVVVVRRKRDAW